MMYNYIKVNRKVYQYLRERGLSPRFENEDGSVYLWKFDLASLGGNNEQTIRKIGGVGMSRDEVANEQKGKIKVTLPMPEDDRFVIEVPDAGNSRNDDAVTIPSEGEVQVLQNKKQE